MAKVAAYILQGNSLARLVVPPMARGAVAAGDDVTIMKDTDYTTDHPGIYDAAIFWGFVETCQAIMSGYNVAGKAAVYLDLAYWHRNTHYKVSVGARHPTKYFQKVQHPNDRWLRVGGGYRNYRGRDDGATKILIAGMSAKAAWAEKCEPVESWERNAVAELHKYTDKAIVYRPKPSWSGAKPIPGAEFNKGPLSFDNIHAVVTHHSNVAVEGLVAGIPAFVWDGVAVPMGLQDLSKIETPYYPRNRELWLHNVAYCQWTLEEMGNGTCWRHLKSEGLVK